MTNEAAEWAPGRGTEADERPPILRMVRRDGLATIEMLDDIGRAAIGPSIDRTIDRESLVDPNEYDVVSRLA